MDQPHVGVGEAERRPGHLVEFARIPARLHQAVRRMAPVGLEQVGDLMGQHVACHG
jgi:hypothetical protein